MSFFKAALIEIEFTASLPTRSYKGSRFYFEADFQITYRPGRQGHCNRNSLIRHEVLQAAREESQSWLAIEILEAEDAINARLGRPSDSTDGFYRDCRARVALHISEQTEKTLHRLLASEARVNHLQYLKTTLYSDASLLLVDFLERDPSRLGDELDIDKFYRFANRLSEAEQWWAPLMQAWGELAAQTQSREAAREALHALLDAIHRLDKKLSSRHGLPSATGSVEGPIVPDENSAG